MNHEAYLGSSSFSRTEPYQFKALIWLLGHKRRGESYMREQLWIFHTHCVPVGPDSGVLSLNPWIGRQDHLCLLRDQLLAVHGVIVGPDSFPITPVVHNGPEFDRMVDVVQTRIVARVENGKPKP